MTLRKRLLNGFYYYLLVSTVVFVFLFMSTFDYVFDGSKRVGDFAGNWLEVLRLIWGVMLGLNATGLLAVIVLKRRQAHISDAAFILFTVFIFLLFALPPLVFLCRISCF